MDHSASDHLNLIADMTSLQAGSAFKAAAFRKAAEVVASLEVPVSEGLRSKGIGKSSRAILEDFLQRGTSARLESLVREICPAEVMTMTRVKGIGAKTALSYWKDHNCRNFNDLVDLAASGKLRDDVASSVIDAITKSRLPHAVALEAAEMVLSEIRDLCERIEIAGSIRRKTADSKDCDIVAVPKDYDALLQKFSRLGTLQNSGPCKASLRLSDPGIDVDLWFLSEWYFGAALLYATGSKDHNISLRRLALKGGYVMNEKGVFNVSCTEQNASTQLAGSTEEEIYDFFSLPWQDPWNRSEILE